MVWLRWGTLLSAVLCLFAQENSWECLDKGEVVSEMSKDAELPSVCVLSCTALTYRQIIDRQQKLTVRFRDSQPGESDDFCWFINSRCSTWDEAFVLLSISESVPAEGRIELQTNSPIHPNPVQPHDSPSVLPDDCGLRFDVTPHLKHLQQHSLCVTLKGIMGNSLMCPPFLIIVKKKTETLEQFYSGAIPHFCPQDAEVASSGSYAGHEKTRHTIQVPETPTPGTRQRKE